MESETLIRNPEEAPPPEPQQVAPQEDDVPTACGLTRKELRAIVEEIIG